MNAVIYARFSPRPDEKESHSVEAQLELCRAFAAGRGWTVKDGAERWDKALSGADATRKGLDEAVKLLRRGDVLLVYKLDRLSRDKKLFYSVQDAVKQRGARIVSVSGEGTMDDSEDGELLTDLSVVLAHYDRKKKARYTSEMVKRNMRSGDSISSKPPYGKRIDHEHPVAVMFRGQQRLKYKLIDDPSEQPTVARIVELSRERDEDGKPLSLREICRRLTAEGHRPRGKAWYPEAVGAVIEREAGK
jgi:site-specific DNA recombinase